MRISHYELRIYKHVFFFASCIFYSFKLKINASGITRNNTKGAKNMKKATLAIAVAVILIAAIFAACNGNNTGNVSDTSQDLGGAMSQAATDLSEMFDGTMASDTSNGNLTDTASVTSVNESTTV